MEQNIDVKAGDYVRVLRAAADKHLIGKVVRVTEVVVGYSIRVEGGEYGWAYYRFNEDFEKVGKKEEEFGTEY